MAAVLDFDHALRQPRPRMAQRRHTATAAETTGSVVIFPGVRIERETLDLAHRPAGAEGSESI